MAANEYWLKRLKRDRALAERATEEVTKEVRKAYRGQYLTISRRLDELYAEAQRRGELSRTKLWNYRTYRDMERELRGFCEVNVQTQRGAMYSCLDHVFEEIIGASPARFRQEKYIVPYNPRAVIDTAWSGEHFSDRIWRNTEALADQIRAEAQQVVMGLKSPGRIKQDLMRAYDVSWNQAERLVDTEVSYVLNKANLENYRRMDCKKVTIVNLDVNTCEKCKALEGEVFEIEDAPVLPIHPRCHCSFCIPREGDDAEVTASGEHLEEVYTRKGVKGYEEAPQYTPANAPRSTKAAPSVHAKPAATAQAQPSVQQAEPAVQPVAKSAQVSSHSPAPVPAQEKSGVSSPVPVLKQGNQLALAFDTGAETGAMINQERHIAQPEYVQNVAEEYQKKATPGKGTFSLEDGYTKDTHMAEIKDAELIIRELGGTIILRKERNGQNEKTPDYTWNGKDWEQKAGSSATSIDNAIRKGAKQISENPGGIVLNMGDSKLRDDEVKEAIGKRFKRISLRCLDVIIVRQGRIQEIVRFSKQ